MSTNLDLEHEKRRLRLLELYAPRRPMVRLPKQYRVTPTNPDPPLVHFAIPLDVSVLYKYADEHNLTKYLPHIPHIKSGVTLLNAAAHLSEVVNYELDFGWPFRQTADCGVILALYNNFTTEERMLVEEDQEDVIQMVQEALGLDKSVRPKWYFDIHDPWLPDD